MRAIRHFWGRPEILRKAPRRTNHYAIPVPPPSAAASKKALLEKQRTLFAMAKEVGYCLEKTSYYEAELAAAVATRLQNRRGQNIYQNTSFNLPSFPRHAAQSLLPEALLQPQHQGSNNLCWLATNVKEQVRELFGESLMKS